MPPRQRGDRERIVVIDPGEGRWARVRGEALKVRAEARFLWDLALAAHV